MHELSYISKILRLALESVRENKIENVKTVEIEVGEMTGALPELLEKAYSESIPNTPLKDSALVIKNVPVTAVCDACGHEYHPSKENDYRCPTCNSVKSHITAGREVSLVSIIER